MNEGFPILTDDNYEVIYDDWKLPQVEERDHDVAPPGNVPHSSKPDSHQSPHIGPEPTLSHFIFNAYDPSTISPTRFHLNPP